MKLFLSTIRMFFLSIFDLLSPSNIQRDHVRDTIFRYFIIFPRMERKWDIEQRVQQNFSVRALYLRMKIHNRSFQKRDLTPFVDIVLIWKKLEQKSEEKSEFKELS